MMYSLNDTSSDFWLALLPEIRRLGDQFQIKEEDRLIKVLEFAAHDRRAEVGLERLLGDLGRIETWFLLDEVRHEAVEKSQELIEEHVEEWHHEA